MIGHAENNRDTGEREERQVTLWVKHIQPASVATNDTLYARPANISDVRDPIYRSSQVEHTRPARIH
jgi:hypothetical protein